MGQAYCPAVLVEEPPEFEFRNGLFYVCCPISGVCRAYRPNTYFQTIAKMVEVGREWRVEQSGKVERIDHWREPLPDHATQHG